ncbi:MAG: MerR family transcriptional regulator [Gammaproteobacteria bacterium]
MKMRELERTTGVNRETIRVYLRYGLVPAPLRPKTNVADYDASHVDAIRTVRMLQKDQGLTLPQIRAILAGGSAVTGVVPDAFPHLERLVAGRLDEFEAWVPLDSVLSRNPRAREDSRALSAIGAITPRRRGGRTLLTRTDAELVGIWGGMRAAGFTEELGFSPAVLRFYVDCARDLAQREVSEFLKIVGGRIDASEAAGLALEALQRMLPFFGLLRTKAVLDAMRAHAPSADPPMDRAAPRR